MVRKSYIGVDLHTNKFNACYLKRDGSKICNDFELTEKGLNEFKKTLYKGDEVAIEATSNAYFFRKQIRGKVKKVTPVAPSKFAIIGKSIKKTDQEDAEKLATFLLKKMLPIARLRSEEQVQLKSFIDDRSLLVRSKTNLILKAQSIAVRNGYKIPKNRLSSKSGFEKYIMSLEWKNITKRELIVLHNQIQTTTENITLLDKEIEGLASQMYGYKNLLSILGIGSLTAAILLYTIGDINDFPDPKNLCSYFGIVPKIRQSNETAPRCRISKAGSKEGRTALIQATWVTIRYSPYLKNYYERLKVRGAPKKAIVACSRKLLTTIYYTLKNDWIFDDFGNYKYHIRGNN
jgi:transposase